MHNIFQETREVSTFINISGDRLKNLKVPHFPKDALAEFKEISEKLHEATCFVKKVMRKVTCFLMDF